MDSSPQQTGRALDRYGDAHLPSHLLQAGLYPQLLFLLSDPDFLAAKLMATNPGDLLSDLRAAGSEVPSNFDQEISPTTIEGWRRELIDNLRLFSREARKFADWDVEADPAGFDQRYVYGIQRWELSNLMPHVTDRLADPGPGMWSLAWIADSESQTTDDLRILDDVQSCTTTLDGRRLVVAHHDRIDVWTLDAGQLERTIPFAGAAGLASDSDGRRISIVHDGDPYLLDLDTMTVLPNMGRQRGFLVDSAPTEAAVSARVESADGLLAVVADAERGLFISDARSGWRRLATLNGIVTALALSSDERRVMAGTDDGQLYSIGLGEQETATELSPSLEDSIKDLLVSMDGRLLVALTMPLGKWGYVVEDGSQVRVKVIEGLQTDRPTAIHIWRLEDDYLLGKLGQTTSEVTSSCFSPSGKMLLLGEAHGGIEIWDSTPESLTEGLTGADRAPGGARYIGGANPQAMTRSVALSSVAAAVGTGLVSVVAETQWMIAVGLVVVALVVASSLYSVAQAAVVVASSNRARRSGRAAVRFRVLDGWTKALSVIALLGVVVLATRTASWMSYLAVLVAPTASLLLVYSVLDAAIGRGWIRGARQAQSLHQLSGHAAAVDWLGATPDDLTVLSHSSRDGLLRLWSLGENDTAPVFHEGGVTTMLAVGSRGLLATGGLDGRLITWDVDQGEATLAGSVHRRSVTIMAAAPDESCIVTAGKDGAIVVWRLDDSTRLPLVFDEHESLASDVHVLSGGRVISIDLESTVLVWSLETGQIIRRLDVESIDRLQVSPSERFAVGFSVGLKQVLEISGVVLNPDYEDTQVIDLATGDVVQWLPSAERVDFLGDDRQVLLVGKERLRVVDPMTGEVRLSTRRLGGLPVVAPDLRHVVFASDHAIYRWYLDDGRLDSTPTDSIVGRPEVVSGDGRVLVTAIDDGLVRAWELETGALLASVRVDGSPQLASIDPGSLHPGLHVAVGDDAGRVYRLDLIPAGP